MGWRGFWCGWGVLPCKLSIVVESPFVFGGWIGFLLSFQRCVTIMPHFHWQCEIVCFAALATEGDLERAWKTGIHREGPVHMLALGDRGPGFHAFVWL